VGVHARYIHHPAEFVEDHDEKHLQGFDNAQGISCYEGAVKLPSGGAEDVAHREGLLFVLAYIDGEQEKQDKLDAATNRRMGEFGPALLAAGC
jgi:hypothetical protein